MSGPDIDATEKNVIGGLDRLVINIALAVLSVFSTLFAVIVTPWRLTPLLTADEPDGRRGMLLSPGVFFVTSITVIMLVAGLFATPEIVASNEGVIGPGYAKQISAAVLDGDVWRVASLIGPIYALAITIGVLSVVLNKFVGPAWTLQTGLRAGLYQMAASICWIIATSAVIDLFGESFDRQLSNTLYALNAAPILFIPLWQYFWFFRKIGALTIFRAALLAATMFAMIVGLIFAIGQINIGA